MAAHEFFFAVDLSGQVASSELLLDLVSRVLAQAGCAVDAVPTVVDALQTAAARSAAVGEQACRMTFIVQDNHLEIVASSAAGRLWWTTQPLA